MTMNAEQIARARQEKKQYLLSVLLMLVANACMLLVDSALPNQQTASILSRAFGFATLGFGMIMTWRLCRAIGIGTGGTLLATVLAPFVIIIEMVILLRIYSKRTGLGLTFMMGDREQARRAA